MPIPPEAHCLHTLNPQPSWDSARLKDILREQFPWLSGRDAGTAVLNGLVRQGDPLAQ